MNNLIKSALAILESSEVVTEDVAQFIHLVTPIIGGAAALTGMALGGIIGTQFPKIEAYIKNLSKSKRLTEYELKSVKAALAKVKQKIASLKTEEGKAKYAQQLMNLELRLDAIEPLNTAAGE